MIDPELYNFPKVFLFRTYKMVIQLDSLAD